MLYDLELFILDLAKPFRIVCSNFFGKKVKRVIRQYLLERFAFVGSIRDFLGNLVDVDLQVILEEGIITILEGLSEL